MSERHGTFAKYWAKNKNSSIGQVVCERCIASRGEEINIQKRFHFNKAKSFLNGTLICHSHQVHIDNL